MTRRAARRSQRLDALVRQVTKIDEDVAATLADPAIRQALMEEIVRMPTTEKPAPPRATSRRDAIFAAAGTAVAVATSVIVAWVGGLSVPSPAAPPAYASGDVFGGAGSCIESYSPQALTQRGFAFAGTVTSIGKRSGGEETYVPVTFTVTTWYRGGGGDKITVAMFPPGEVTSTGGGTYAVGSSLLVSGEARFGGDPLRDPVAWGCGFTRWDNPTDATAWEQALR